MRFVVVAGHVRMSRQCLSRLIACIFFTTAAIASQLLAITQPNEDNPEAPLTLALFDPVTNSLSLMANFSLGPAGKSERGVSRALSRIFF